MNQDKTIKFSDDARNSLARGVQQLTDVVKTTMGPSGRNVLIQKLYGAPVLTKDGVSVAQEVFFEDPLENMGAQLVKEVASNVANEAGDGTTTATVLSNAIFQAGLKNVTAGSNPVEMKKGMDEVKSFLLEELKNSSKKITTSKEVAQVATISANGDEKIGEMIAEAMDRVGKDGVITVEQSKTYEDELEVVEGMTLDSGYISPYFVTNTEKMTCELIKPLILMTNHRIFEMKDLLPTLEYVQQQKRPLLLICEEIEGDVLSTIVVNKMRKIFDICVIKAPGFNENKLNILEDIGILTAGEVISGETGKKVAGTQVQDLGTCEKVIINKSTCTIVGGAGDEKKIATRVEDIKTLLVSSKVPYDQMNLKNRLSKLAGGVAVIKVGAATETEMKEKKDRIDDALGATKAAVEEGIIIGGGCALLKAGEKFQNNLEGDKAIGAAIVLQGIKAPVRQIIENTGEDAGYIMSLIVKETATVGYDAKESEMVDMLGAGIIDSLKVSRVALSNAISVASMLLTTEASINIKKSSDVSV